MKATKKTRETNFTTEKLEKKVNNTHRQGHTDTHKHLLPLLSDFFNELPSLRLLYS